MAKTSPVSVRLSPELLEEIEREARVRGPGLGCYGRRPLRRLGLPAAEVREDLAHHRRIVD